MFLFFSTGLVRLYIAGLPLRSCRTIRAPSVQGSAQCAFFFVSGSSRIRTHVYFSLRSGHINHYPILTPQCNVTHQVVDTIGTAFFLRTVMVVYSQILALYSIAFSDSLSNLSLENTAALERSFHEKRLERGWGMLSGKS